MLKERAEFQGEGVGGPPQGRKAASPRIQGVDTSLARQHIVDVPMILAREAAYANRECSGERDIDGGAGVVAEVIAV